MYSTIFSVHHYLAMATLVFILLFTAVAFIYNLRSRVMSSQLKSISFITLLLVHTQLVVGIVLFVLAFQQNPIFEDMGMLMKNSQLRQRFIEHPCTMIIIAILLTIANVKIKKAGKVNISVVIMTALSLALAIAMVPRVFWGKLLPI